MLTVSPTYLSRALVQLVTRPLPQPCSNIVTGRTQKQQMPEYLLFCFSPPKASISPLFHWTPTPPILSFHGLRWQPLFSKLWHISHFWQSKTYVGPTQEKGRDCTGKMGVGGGRGGMWPPTLQYYCITVLAYERNVLQFSLFTWMYRIYYAEGCPSCLTRPFIMFHST